MRIKLLEDFKGRKAGREWDCPFAALGRQLVEAGTALAVEECDRHLNPPAGAPAETTEAEQPAERADAEPAGGGAAEQPAGSKPKRVRRR